MDIRQSSNYAKYMESLGWRVEKAGPSAGGANVFIRHFPIFSRWSVIKVQRPEKVDFKRLEEIAKKHHALFVKLEPAAGTQSTDYGLQKNGFKADNWPLLPSKTLVLDISPSIDDFYESLEKDTRYEIRQAMKRGMEVSDSQDIELFYRFLQETMKIGKWNIPIHKEVLSLWQSFQPSASQILLGYQSGLPVGGCLLIWNKDRAHYMYAALTNKGRNVGAAYLILFEAIKYLKKKGIKSLDLEGIYDERFPKMTSDWQGFTKFKKGWGGKELAYLGSVTRYFYPFLRFVF